MDKKNEVVKDPIIGQPYHLSWAKRGCVWILKSIIGEDCILQTPSRNKKRIDKLANLRHTNKQLNHDPTRA